MAAQDTDGSDFFENIDILSSTSDLIVERSQSMLFRDYIEKRNKK